MKMLTVIISFLNEGKEVAKTMESIRLTAGNEVDIICVNDASIDGYNYQKDAQKYGALYIENKERLGCAEAREVGVSFCKTNYFLIVDGHMRFYHNYWWKEFEIAIKEEPRAIYCCRCKPWDYLTGEETNNGAPYGAYIKIFDKEARSILNATWAGKVFPDEKIVDIPCVLGACYAAEKRYWDYLKGLKGLIAYGCDEAYISLKAWMEGGRCRLLTNIQIGHLFRNKFPYPIEDKNIVYNKLFIATTLFEDPLKSRLIRVLKAVDYVLYVSANEILKKRNNQVEEFKQYYHNILNAGYKNFEILNEEIISKMIVE